MYKSRKLTESYINFLNSHNPYLIAIVVRTHIEVVGSVSYLYKKLISYYNGNSSINIVEKALDRMLYGTKMKELFADSTDPINVMTYIQCTDEMYEKITNGKKADCEIMYNFISEICHTNLPGQLLAFEIDEKTKENTYQDENEFDYNKNEICQYNSFFLNSILLFELFYNESMKMLQDNEDLPSIER